MKVGITGVAGFIGSHLCDALIARGDCVVGVDNLSMGSLDNIRHHESGGLLEFHQIDVRDLPAMERVFRSADCIVHLAAFKIPRYGNAIETLDVNGQGGRNALELGRHGNRRVVLASTSDVYGKNPQLPFSEDSDSVIGPSTVPRWSYAVSKLYEEHLAFAYQATYGVPVSLLRFFGSYGPRQHLSWWGGPQSVFISAVLKNEPIEIHGDGSQTRSFTYISDLVDGIVRAIDYQQRPAIVFNLGNTREITILQLANEIIALCGDPAAARIRMVPYQDFKIRYEDVMRRVPDISQAQSLLGFRPGVDLREGLQKTIAWQRAAMGL